MKGDPEICKDVKRLETRIRSCRRKRGEDQPWVVVESLIALISDRDLSHLATLIISESLERGVDNEDPETFQFACCPDKRPLHLQVTLWPDEED